MAEQITPPTTPPTPEQPAAVPFTPPTPPAGDPNAIAPAPGTPPAPPAPQPPTPGEPPAGVEPPPPPPPAATKEDIEDIKTDLGDRLKQEISQEVAEKFVKSLKGEGADTPDEKKIDFSQAPWNKENRTPTWVEALEWVGTSAGVSEERIAKNVMKNLNKEAEADEEVQKKATEQVTANQEAVKTNWEAELADLEKQGKIPAIQDPNNPNDPGRIARAQLYDVINQRVLAKQSAGQQILPADISVKIAYYEDVAGKPQQPGRSAPVAGARRGATPGVGGSVPYNYGDIHSRPWEAIIAEGQSR